MEKSASAVAVIVCILPFCCWDVGFGVGGVITLFIMDFIKLLGSSFKFKFNESRCDSKPFMINLLVKSSVIIFFVVAVVTVGVVFGNRFVFWSRKTLWPSKQCINSCACSQLAHNQFTQSAHLATAIDCFPRQPVHLGNECSFSTELTTSDNLKFSKFSCWPLPLLAVSVIVDVFVLFLRFWLSTLLLLVKTKSSHIAESLIGGDDPLPLTVDGESDK